jgi:hypothetical protein
MKGLSEMKVIAEILIMLLVVPVWGIKAVFSLQSVQGIIKHFF